jgi:DNA-binding NarL/FixJ family response regulator
VRGDVDDATSLRACRDLDPGRTMIRHFEALTRHSMQIGLGPTVGDRIQDPCQPVERSAMAYRVLLVDKHRLLREGIKAIMERTDEFDVVAEAENGVQAVKICKKIQPDLVLMDIGLPGMNGIEATSEILRYCPSTNVMILTMHDDQNSVVAAFRSGVRAFLLKKVSSSDLLDAMRTVSKGGSYLSPEVSDHLLTRIQHGDLEASQAPSPLDKLSPREHQVLRLVAEGKTSKDIATMLELGLQTVRTYRKMLMKKIGVNNVAGLTQVALAAGLTSWDKPEPGAKSEK